MNTKKKEEDLKEFLLMIDTKISILQIQYPFLSAHQVIPQLRELDNLIKSRINDASKNGEVSLIKKYKSLRENIRSLQKRSLSKKGCFNK